jgi:hypothetical protein
VLARLAEYHGAWLGDDLAVITMPASLTDQAGRWLPELIATVRLNGRTGTRSPVRDRQPHEAGCDSTAGSPVAEPKLPSTFNRKSYGAQSTGPQEGATKYETRTFMTRVDKHRSIEMSDSFTYD